MVIRLILQSVLKYYTSPKTFIPLQNKFLAMPLLGIFVLSHYRVTLNHNVVHRWVGHTHGFTDSRAV